MNERIQKLAEQAGFYYTDKTGFITPAGCDPEKFAELIVKECAGLLDGEWEKEILCGSDAAGILKQHFGVEE